MGDAVAVTIIATGFNAEQQKEIINTAPNKIIHTLDGEQKLVQDLTASPVVSSASPLDEPLNTSSQKIVFELMEEEIVAEQEPVINENELLFISEYIKSLDVTFEIVSPEKPVQFQIESAPLAVTEIPVYEHQVVAKEEQVTFTFDLPLVKSEPEVDENKILFELTNETKNIVVNQPVQVVPMTELNENGIVKYSLEEYMEVESDLISSKPVAVVEEPVAPEMDITMKVDEAVSFTSSYDEVSPLEMSIEETLKFRADERRRKLKDFNYKFSNSSSRIEEFEREPAYKRSGIDVTTNPLLNTASRTSLGVDSNDDLQLRSNNSFLHDNVD